MVLEETMHHGMSLRQLRSTKIRLHAAIDVEDSLVDQWKTKMEQSLRPAETGLRREEMETEVLENLRIQHFIAEEKVLDLTWRAVILEDSFVPLQKANVS